MVARAYRLYKKEDFRHLFTRGRRLQSPALTFIVVPNNKKTIRSAVVVSTTITKRATKRNTLRRRIIEQFRRELPHLTSGYDCVFIVRPPALRTPREELSKLVVSLLTRARLFL